MNRRYRKTVIAANWKMNKSPAEAKEFIMAVRERMAKAKWCDVVLCVPFLDIPTAVKSGKGGKISIGAQNCHYMPSGAFTGEVSCEMLSSAGVKYVIIGHSERRRDFNESDEMVNQKVLAALEAGLRPIVCVGESLAQREADITLDVIRMQTKMALRGVDPTLLRRVVIAYEPIWAIGTGKTATVEQADEAGRAIRECLRGLFGARVARSVSILYGGSMNEKNARELMSMPDVDGGLIGGASLDPESFCKIVDAANQ